MKRLAILIGLILFTAIFIAVSWYLVTPLFFDRVIDEKSPYTFPTDGEIGRIVPPAALPTGTKAEQTARRIIPPPADGMLTARAILTNMEKQAVQGAVESQQNATKIATPLDLSPSVVYSGTFVDGDAFHKGSGNATVFAELDGSYLLHFAQFKTTNGPDVHVLLSPHASPNDFTQLGDYLDLGSLKGNVGDQNYNLPADFDPTRYKSVVIYCQPFRVIFATATLE